MPSRENFMIIGPKVSEMGGCKGGAWCFQILFLDHSVVKRRNRDLFYSSQNVSTWILRMCANQHKDAIKFNTQIKDVIGIHHSSLFTKPAGRFEKEPKVLNFTVWVGILSKNSRPTMRFWVALLFRDFLDLSSIS